MDQKYTPPNLRKACPGDIFLLLVPTAQELHRLREMQQVLRSRFGGNAVEFVHITCERFSPEQEDTEKVCIDYLEDKIKTLSPFPLFSDRLVKFFAPYWGEEVLRWQVQETEMYRYMRTLIAASLTHIGCESHFDRGKPTTCTALRLGERNNSTRLKEARINPILLFQARHFWISKLVRVDEFEILEKLRLEGRSED